MWAQPSKLYPTTSVEFPPVVRATYSWTTVGPSKAGKTASRVPSPGIVIVPLTLDV